MKLNKSLLSLLFFYLIIGSSLIETKNIIQKTILTRAKLYKKMERIKIKKGFKESILKTLKDTLYSPMTLYNWIFKSEPVDAEGNSSQKDKIQGFILLIMEIIRAFDFNPISQLIGKVLDSYDQVETCVNNSEQILSTFNEAFFASKESDSDSDEKQKMQKQQTEIINLLLEKQSENSSESENSSSENSEAAKLQKCLRAENIVKNPQDHINKMLAGLIVNKDPSNRFFDILVNLKLSARHKISIQQHKEILQSLKAEFYAKSVKRVEALQFSNYDVHNFCVTYNAKFFCIRDYEEIRAKFLEETTILCDLNYKPSMKFEQFFNLYVCEEFDFMNKDWKINSLKTMFKARGYVPFYQDIKLFTIPSLFGGSLYRLMAQEISLAKLISNAITNLFDIETSVKEPTRQEFEKFLFTKLDQFKDGLDCSAFKPQSWLDSLFKIFGMLRKALKAIANVLRVFNNCVNPTFNALQNRTKQIQAQISRKALFKFGESVKENEKNALLEAAKADSLEALGEALKVQLYSNLDAEAKVAKEIKEEEASSLAEFEPKKSESETESQGEGEGHLQAENTNNKELEKNKINQAIDNAAKLQILTDADKPKIEDSFASADSVMPDLFSDPFSDADADSGVYAREAVKALREAQVPEKIVNKLKEKKDKFISEQKKEFEKNPFAYSTKIAANGVMCAAQPWLCAARGAAYFAKFAVVDEVDMQADKLIKKAMNSQMIKDAPELVQDMVEFAAKKGKKNLLKKLDKKIEKKMMKGNVVEFDKKEINSEAFKDVKMLGDAVDFLSKDAKKLVLDEIQKKFPGVPVSEIAAVGETGYEFYKFRQEKKAKQNQSKEKTSYSAAYKKRKLFKKRLSSEKRGSAAATAAEDSNNNFISETSIFIENNKLYLNYQLRLMLQEELKSEMPIIKEKLVNYLNKGVTGALAVHNSFSQLSDLQNDLSTIFPSLVNFFKDNLQKLIAYIVQLVGLGPINVLLYGKDIIDFMLLLKQALSAKNVKDRWRSFGKIIGVVIKFFRGDKFKFFGDKFLSFFSYRRRLLKRRF